MSIKTSLNYCIKAFASFSPKWLKGFVVIVLSGVLLGLTTRVFAGNSSDILAGTTTQATSTLTGSGKTWIYLIECVAAVAAYIKTKNIMSLIGIVVIALFLNIVLHIAGVTS